MIVVTSTNCSAVCSAKCARRLQCRDGDEILGTSITSSGIWKSICRHTSTSWFSICGTRTSSDGTTSVLSTICSTVRRWSLSCGLTSKSRSGRAPSVSSPYKSKNTGSSLELTVLWLLEASYVSGPAPRNEEWCRAAANSMRTVIRSCRSYERSWRSLLRLAAELPESRATKAIVTR